MPPEPLFIFCALFAGVVRYVWLWEEGGPSFRAMTREALLSFFIVAVMQPVLVYCGIPTNLAPIIALGVGIAGPEASGKLVVERIKNLFKK